MLAKCDSLKKLVSDFRQNLVVFLAVLGMIIILVIGIVIFCERHTLLTSLQNPDAVRGLITFMVVFITVAIALILVIYAVAGGSDSSNSSGASDTTGTIKDRFGYGKEIFSLLIGVLGTILGFYYGQAIPNQQLISQGLGIAPINLSSDLINAGDTFKLTSYISGGKSPYTYSVFFDPPVIKAIEHKSSQNGVIDETLQVPPLQEDTKLTVKITATDSTGDEISYDNQNKKISLNKK